MGRRSFTVSVLITTLIGAVCVILYSDKFHGVSSSNKKWHSETSVGSFWVKLTKRSESESDSDGDSRNACILQKPSENDLLLLRKPVLNSVGEKGTNGNVVCYVKFRCTAEKGHVSVECSSRSCSSVSVTFKETNVKKSRLNMQMLAEIVEVMDDLGTVDISEKLSLSCDDQTKTEGRIYSKLNLEYTGNRYCTNNSAKRYQPMDINIFFFRFLSRQSMMAKMTSLMTAIGEDGTSDVIDFRKFQSTQWKFTKSLSVFLQGTQIFNVSKPSLLTLAEDSGFDVELFGTFGEKSPPHEAFVKLIARQLNHSCGNNVKSNHSHRKCCFSSINEEFGLQKRFQHLKECFFRKQPSHQKWPVFRMSFLNYIDFSPELIMVDTLLSDVIKLLSKQQNSVTILLSDVGDPIYSTLASSLFLQTEASNPFLFIVTPRRVFGRASNPLLRTAKWNAKQLIHMSDIHETVTDIIYLVSGHFRKENSNLKRTSGIGRSLFMARDYPMKCASLKITPPGLCICEDQFSVYPNDTLQVGFAEVALGVINNRILDYAFTRFGHNTYDLSPLLRGKSFSKLRVRSHQGSQQRVVDISYTAENSDLTEIIFNVTVTFDPLMKTCTVGVLGRTELIDDAFIETYFSAVIRHISRLYFPRKLSTPLKSVRLSGKHFGVSPREIAMHQNCLVLLKSDFMDSATFEIANICSDRKYHFRFDSNLLDAVSLIALPISFDLGPGDFRFLTSFVKSSYLVHHGMFHYETDFDVMYL